MSILLPVFASATVKVIAPHEQANIPRNSIKLRDVTCGFKESVVAILSEGGILFTSQTPQAIRPRNENALRCLAAKIIQRPIASIKVNINYLI